MLITRSQSECTEEQKECARRRVRESKAQAQEDKLIRLDDLIPKENVMGGCQLLFGVTDTQETNQNKKEE
jgi:hypothetical protein